MGLRSQSLRRYDFDVIAHIGPYFGQKFVRMVRTTFEKIEKVQKLSKDFSNIGVCLAHIKPADSMSVREC